VAYQEYGWVTGVPLGVETPGLMTGLAGIGYELLRLAAPERVPSVLLLAPPAGRAKKHRDNISFTAAIKIFVEVAQEEEGRNGE
jgi:hypothetical protein